MFSTGQSQSSWIVSLAIAFFLTASPCVSLGQNAAEVTISKIDPQFVMAPAINYGGAPPKNLPAKKWAEIETTFSWQPTNPAEKYTDDLTANYYVLLNNRSALRPQGTLLTGQVSLSSIPARSLDPSNSQLRTVMYISPRSLERFFGGKSPADPNTAIVDVGVTFSKQGQVVAYKSLKSTSGAWWPQYQQLPGFLLNKQETPFAPLNWDFYEAGKKP